MDNTFLFTIFAISLMFLLFAWAWYDMRVKEYEKPAPVSVEWLQEQTDKGNAFLFSDVKFEKVCPECGTETYVVYANVLNLYAVRCRKGNHLFFGLKPDRHYSQLSGVDVNEG